MKFSGLRISAVGIFVAISLSSAFPLVKRADTILNVNPLLFNIPYATVTKAAGGNFTVGLTTVTSLPAALEEVCKQHFNSAQQALADCQTTQPANSPQCTKPNGQPIDGQALTKDADQCIAHQLVQNGNTFTVNPLLFNSPIPSITQSGNNFTVGTQSFNNVGDAQVAACKQQRQTSLATLDNCQKNPSDQCNKVSGQPITREDVNKQNSVCFSFGLVQAN